MSSIRDYYKREAVYEAVVELVKRRLEKARSV